MVPKKDFKKGRKMRVIFDDHNAALWLCHEHLDKLDDQDILACNEVARGWANNNLVDVDFYDRFAGKLQKIKSLSDKT